MTGYGRAYPARVSLRALGTCIAVHLSSTAEAYMAWGRVAGASAGALLAGYVATHGSRLSLTVRRSAASVDWLHAKEPRAARPVCDLFLERLAEVDSEVGQLVGGGGGSGRPGAGVGGSGAASGGPGTGRSATGAAPQPFGCARIHRADMQSLLATHSTLPMQFTSCRWAPQSLADSGRALWS